MAKSQSWTEYQASVRGTIWQGGEGCTSYKFDHKPTRAEVMAKAGDFEQVTAITLMQKITKVTLADLTL